MSPVLRRGVFASALLLAAALSVTTAAADAVKTGFVNKTFTNADGSTSPYVVFVPHGYDGTKAYPVILFLHGAGETKQPNAKKEGKMPVEVGIGPAIKKREQDFPSIVVIPRAEGFGWGAGTANATRALAILDATTKEYKTDPKRVYLTGLSMGGAGTWSIAAAHPDRWAAIVPICAPGNVADAAKYKGIPVRSFVGDQDREGTVKGMQAMADAIKAAGGTVTHTVYPGVPHNSWDRAYAEKDLFPWLLEQKTK